MIKFLIVLLFGVQAFATLNNSDLAQIFPHNYLSGANPGAENGTAGWVATGGTFTTTTTASQINSGGRAFSFDASATDQILSSPGVSLKDFKGNGVAACFFKTDATDYLMQVYDGSAVLAQITISSSSDMGMQAVNFIPSSNSTYQIYIKSQSNASVIYVDDCMIGPAFNIQQVSQAEQYGTLKYAETTNCQWSAGNTGGAYTEFPADTDCAAPTVTGNASAPSTKVPRIKFASLPPGRYMVVMTGGMTPENGSTTATLSWRMYDGTTQSGLAQTNVNSTSNTTPRTNTLIGIFNYTAVQTNIEFRPVAQSTSDSNDPLLDAGTSTTIDDLEFSVYRYPTTPQLAFNPSIYPNSWSGYHDSTCSWSRTNTAYGDPTADSTCTLTERNNTNFGAVTSYLSGSDKLPGIVFTPTRAQSYLVCANTTIVGATNGATAEVQLWDGTTVIAERGTNVPVNTYGVPAIICGIYHANSTANVTLSLQSKASSGSVTISPLGATITAIEWTIVSITQGVNAPNIINSVTNNSSGMTRVEVADLNCDSSATINSQLGTWVSSVGNISSGVCAVTFTAGIFSSAPYCQLTAKRSQVNSIIDVQAQSVTTSGFNLTGALISSGSSTIAAATAFDAWVTCVGAH